MFASLQSQALEDGSFTGNGIVTLAWGAETKELAFVNFIAEGTDTPQYALTQVGYLAVSPDSLFLVSVAFEEMALSLFSFDPTTGTTTFIEENYDKKSPNGASKGQPLTGGLGGVVSVIVYDGTDMDPTTTKKAFTACDGGSEIGIFEVFQAGGLNYLGARRTQGAGQDLAGCLGATDIFLKMRNPTSLAADKDGGFLFGAFSGNGALGIFNVLGASAWIECRHVIKDNAALDEHRHNLYEILPASCRVQ